MTSMCKIEKDEHSRYQTGVTEHDHDSISMDTASSHDTSNQHGGGGNGSGFGEFGMCEEVNRHILELQEFMSGGSTSVYEHNRSTWSERTNGAWYTGKEQNHGVLQKDLSGYNDSVDVVGGNAHIWNATLGGLAQTPGQDTCIRPHLSAGVRVTRHTGSSVSEEVRDTIQCLKDAMSIGESSYHEQEFYSYQCQSTSGEEVSSKQNFDENTKFQCNVCMESFSCQQNLDDHSTIHLAKHYECLLCSESFATKLSLKSHLVNQHLAQQKFKCNLCLNTYPTLCQLEEHVCTQQKISSADSEQDSMGFRLGNDTVKGTESSHLEEDNQKGGKDSVSASNDCPSQVESSFQEKQSENAVKEPSSKPDHDLDRRCSVCQKVFRYTSSLKIHSRIHTGEMPFECNVCLERFHFHMQLRRHLKKNIGSGRLQCKVCLRHFAKCVSLKEHMKECHPGHSQFGSKTEAVKEDCPRSTAHQVIGNPLEYRRPHLQTRSVKSTKDTNHADCLPQQENQMTRSFSEGSVASVDVYKDTSQQKPSEYQCPPLQMHSIKSTKDTNHAESSRKEKKTGTDSALPKDDSQSSFERPRCTVCHQVFRDQRNLAMHMRYHTGERPHCCHLCEKKFFSSGALQLHLKKNNARKLLECPECPQNLSLCSQLKAHVKDQHPDEYNSGYELQFPVRIKGDNNGKSQRSEVVESSSNVQNKRSKSDEKVLPECDICHKVFSHPKNLKMHMRFHTNYRPFKCRLCHSTFTHSCYFLKHTNKNDADKPLKCLKCNETFTVCSQHKSHIKLVHGLGYDAQYNKYISESDGRVVAAHPIRNKSMGQSLQHRNKSSKSRSQRLVKSVRVDESRKYSKYHCTALQKHNRKSTKGRSHADSCGQKEKTRVDSILAKDSSQSSRKRQSCTICPKVLSGRNSLAVHMRQHTGERPHRCHLCEKRFFSSGALQFHLKKNNAKKVLECPECPKAFSLCSQLKAHIKDCHPETYTSGYEFQFCEKMRSDINNTKSHRSEEVESPSKLQDKLAVCPQSENPVDGHHQECETDHSVEKGHKGEQSSSVDSKDISFQCHMCQMRFKSDIALNRHLKQNYRKEPLKCILCNESSSMCFIVKKHVEEIHGLNYESDYCQLLKVRLMKQVERLGVPAGEACADMELDFEGNGSQSTPKCQEQLIMSPEEQSGACTDNVDKAYAQTVTDEDHSLQNFQAQINNESYITQPKLPIAKSSIQDSVEREEGFVATPRLDSATAHNLIDYNQNDGLSQHQKEITNPGTLNTNMPLQQFQLAEETKSECLPQQENQITMSFSEGSVASADFHKDTSQQKPSEYQCPPLQTHSIESAKDANHADSSRKEEMTGTDSAPSNDDSQSSIKHPRCTICQQVFSEQRNLKVHMRFHTGHRPHKCVLCDKRFFSSSGLQKHLKMNNSQKLLQCPECPQNFLFCSQLKAHVRDQHPDKYHSGYELQFPVKIRRDENKTKNQRSEVIEDPSNLQNKGSRTDDRVFPKCDICHKVFSELRNLKMHMRFHTNYRPFKCCLCHSTFTHSRYFQKHTNKNDVDKPLKCLKCNETFTVCSEHKSHIKLVHGLGYDAQYDKYIVVPSVAEGIAGQVLLGRQQDSMCSDNQNQNVGAGQSQEHKSKSLDIRSGEEETVGLDKSKRVATPKNVLSKTNQKKKVVTSNRSPQKLAECPQLEEHVDVLHPEYKSKSSASKRPRDASITNKDCPDIGFQCHMCHLRFKSDIALNQHLQQNYGKEPLKCVLCNESSSMCFIVKKHVEETHSLNYESAYCQLKYSKPRVLVKKLELSRAEIYSEMSELEKAAIEDHSTKKCQNSKSPIETLDIDRYNSETECADIFTNTDNSPPSSPAQDNESERPSPQENHFTVSFLDDSIKMYAYKETSRLDKTAAHNDHDGLQSESSSQSKIKVIDSSRAEQEIVHSGVEIQSSSSIPGPHTQNSKSKIQEDQETTSTCNLCSRSFQQKFFLDSHKKIHSGDMPFECSLCQARHHTRTSLHIHLKKNDAAKQLPCPKCPQQFPLCSQLKKHVSKEHPEDYELQYMHCYGSDGCSRDCRIPEDKSAQLQNQGLQAKEKLPPQCSICKKVVSSNRILKEHMRFHTGETPYKCRWCHERFKRAGKLRLHLLKNNAAKRLECPSCPQTFAVCSQLKDHLKDDHTEYYESISSRYTSNEEVPKNVSTPNSQTATTVEVSAMVITSIVGRQPDSEATGCFKCDVCLKVFSQQLSLTNHMRSHSSERIFECTLCLQQFPDELGLSRHVNQNYSVKALTCQICTETFPACFLLKQHIADDHSGDQEDSHNGMTEGGGIEAAISLQQISSSNLKAPVNCDLCSKVFTTKHHLLTHMKLHRGEKSKECHLCHERFFQSCYLTRHLRKNYCDKLLKCPNCPRNFQVCCQLKKHIEAEHPEQNQAEYNGSKDMSDNCLLNGNDNKTTASSHQKEKDTRSQSADSDMDSHLQSTTLDDVTCHLCNVEFRDDEALRIHMKRHASQDILNCLLCGAGGFTGGSLSEHLKQNKQGVVKCRECYETVINCILLKKHVEDSHSQETYTDPEKEQEQGAACSNSTSTGQEIKSGHVCYVCSEIILHIDDFRRHLKSHDDIESVASTQSTETQPNLERAMIMYYDRFGRLYYRCILCLSVSKTVIGFKCHMKNHKKPLLHSKKKNKNPSDEKPHPCSECNKIFTNKSSLKSHIRNKHRKGFTCDICQMGFPYKSVLDTHTKKKHTGVKDVMCDICSKMFFTLQAVKRHKEDVHPRLEDFIYKCSQCPKTFCAKWRRTFHMKKHHTKRERNFMCHICGSKFYTRTSLESHLRTHTRERAFKCDVCGKSFIEKKHLTNHARLHTGETPYKCDVCQMGFAQQAGLYWHKKRNKCNNDGPVDSGRSEMETDEGDN